MKYLLFVMLAIGLALAAQSQSGVRFNHVAFTVKNLSRSTQFYRDVLGLDTMRQPFDDGLHVWFSVGSGQFHLIEGTDIPVSVKGAHLCFSVPDILLIMERLRRQKLPFEDWKGKPDTFTLRRDGIRQIYLRDPDGYWIELNDER